MQPLKRVLVGMVVFLAAACAGTSGPTRASTPANPDVITEAELAEHANTPVRQAIQRLRPQFLRSRGASSINRTSVDVMAVYLGNSRMGGPEVLDQVRAGDLREIRYMSPTDATQRYGLNHTAGAIVLIPR